MFKKVCDIVFFQFIDISLRLPTLIPRTKIPVTTGVLVFLGLELGYMHYLGPDLGPAGAGLGYL